MITNSIILTLVLVGQLFTLSNGLIVEGQLDTTKNWVFLAKFCFVSMDSQISFNLKYSDSFATENLLLYYDYQWSQIYPHDDMSCDNKLGVLDSQSQILPLTINQSTLNCDYVDSSGFEEIQCKDDRGFITSRPRWWFVALSRCNSSGMSLNYHIEFTNGNNVFVRHFSADQFGIFQATIAFTVFYIIMLLTCITFGVLLFKKSLLHITYRLFVCSVAVETLSFLVAMCQYAHFSKTGIESKTALTLSRVLDAIAQTLFLLMLILVAKGYTITRGRLRQITVIKISLFFLVYVLAYTITFIYSEVGFDPGIVNYFYSSPPGIALIVIKLILGWVWFMYSIVFTIKNFPEKRIFYITLMLFFTLWFFAGPLIIIFSALVIPDYIRESVAYISQSVIISIGHFFFLILVRPTSENKMFPYHVKTNQVGLIVRKEDVAASTTTTNTTNTSNGVVVNEYDNDEQVYPHHAEDKGGNVNFANMTIKDLFTISNNESKYVIENDSSSAYEDVDVDEIRNI